MTFLFSLFPWKTAVTKKSVLSTEISSNENLIHTNQSVKSVSEVVKDSNNPKDVMLFLEPETILDREQCRYLVGEIKEIAGLSDEKFDLYYRPAILTFARLCQSVGASYRNHHSEPYGLIEHSLEVAMYAMRKSQGCVYYPDREVETIQWLERVFMYACFIGGLLHDGAKIFTNFRWYTKNEKNKWMLFNHMIHKIPKESDAVQYRIKPYQNKKGVNVYHQSSHELFAANLFQDVVPQAGMEWIVSYSEEHCAELFIDLVHTLASDYSLGHELGECVKCADQESTDDGIKRYHEANNNRDFVDLSDPNLPLFESFKSIIKEVVKNPNSFNLVTNKVAMGKYSHIEKFGNLIFFSAKSVLPILKKRLSDKGISLPNDQAIFTLMADNGVTLAAPSGDTFWWVEFYSENNSNKSKEVSYFVVDCTKYNDVAIKDLRTFDVKYRFSDKSLCLDEDDEVLPYSEENYQEVYSLLHDSEYELLDKNKAAEGDPIEAVGKESEIVDTSNSNEQPKLLDQEVETKELKDGAEDDPIEVNKSQPSVIFGNRKPTLNENEPADSLPSSKQAQVPLQMSQTSVVAPPRETTPVVPPSTSKSGKNQTNNSTNQKSTSKQGIEKQPSSKKKPRKSTKTSMRKGSMLDKAIGVGLGLDPKALNSSNRSSVGVANGQTRANVKKGASDKIQKKNSVVESNSKTDSSTGHLPVSEAPPISAYEQIDSSDDYSNESLQDYFEMNPQDLSDSPPEQHKIAVMNDNGEEVPEDERPFSMDSRINKGPHTCKLSDRMEKLLARNHGLGCEADTSIYQSDSDQKCLTKLLTTWIPYIEAGLENKTVRANEPSAHIVHLRQGVFFAEHEFRKTFADELVDDLFSQLTNCAATLLYDENPNFGVEFEDGSKQSGVIITVRAFKPHNENLPLYRSAKLLKGNG